MSRDLEKAFGVENRTDRSLRAPMKYAGSKYDCLDELLPKLPYRGSFIDVFGGSGTVLFNRKGSKLDVYNDRHGGICAFYRVLRDHPLELTNRLEIIIHSREEWEWCLKTWDDPAIAMNDVERAARWYYLVQNSFNGLGRSFGRITKATSPIAGVIQNKLPYFWLIHQRLRRAQVENLDWRDCINDYDNADAVFYLDPPYMNADQSGYEHKFTVNEHIALLDRIQTMKGFVALSGYPNELYNSYNWTKTYSWPRRDRANSQAVSDGNNRQSAGNREIMTEMLWIKE